MFLAKTDLASWREEGSALLRMLRGQGRHPERVLFTLHQDKVKCEALWQNVR